MTGLAHANVHHRARSKVQNAFTQLSWAPYATMIGFTFNTHNVAAAFWAALRHVKGLVAARVLLVKHFHDFGNTSPPPSTITQSPIFQPISS